MIFVYICDISLLNCRLAANFMLLYEVKRTNFVKKIQLIFCYSSVHCVLHFEQFVFDYS